MDLQGLEQTPEAWIYTHTSVTPMQVVTEFRITVQSHSLTEMMELPPLLPCEMPEAGTARYYKLFEGKKNNQLTLKPSKAERPEYGNDKNYEFLNSSSST